MLGLLWVSFRPWAAFAYLPAADSVGLRVPVHPVLVFPQPDFSVALQRPHQNPPTHQSLSRSLYQYVVLFFSVRSQISLATRTLPYPHRNLGAKL
ncbi:hypothetical protein C8R43DRAFT_987699 [Mycena crocata]|nr:hypothetical protein C8R43DRAFT_987699 [Mycena crocata]